MPQVSLLFSTLRRVLLSPFSWLYGAVADFRRAIYNQLNLRTPSPIPAWVVGNLHMGGTGKTPMVLFLLDLLKDQNPAVLSRGYGRSTKGFLAVGPYSESGQVGDEPLEIYSASQRPVFVCEKRVAGLHGLMNATPESQLALLDDGFQHLPLQATGYLLLSPFQDPFWKQAVFPGGKLRESIEAAQEAQAIFITKCPADLTQEQAQGHVEPIRELGKPVFFFHYSVSEPAPIWDSQPFQAQEPTFIYSGIAQQENWAPDCWNVQGSWIRKDHAPLGPDEWEELLSRVYKSGAKQLVMTRKDAVKLPKIQSKNLKVDLYVVHSEAKLLFQQHEALKSLILAS
ncbi:MAG: tetraacyldisaccharide 4'-kinase [Bacteroidia bacterium]